MDQQLLPEPKHSVLTLQWLCKLLAYWWRMCSELVLYTVGRSVSVPSLLDGPFLRRRAFSPRKCPDYSRVQYYIKMPNNLSYDDLGLEAHLHLVIFVGCRDQWLLSSSSVSSSQVLCWSHSKTLQKEGSS
jgi:hypothetical protein